MADDELDGKVARVIGTVAPGRIGEVLLAIRGGVEAYYAEPYDGAERIAVGAQCVVVERHRSLARTVLVTAMPSTSDIL